MNGLLVILAIATTVGSLLSSNPAAAQLLPPAKKAERVEITKGPELELATNHLTIIRWTVNNPGGSDVHYGIVRYGTDPKDLSQTAKNPIRLNRVINTDRKSVVEGRSSTQTRYAEQRHSEAA